MNPPETKRRIQAGQKQSPIRNRQSAIVNRQSSIVVIGTSLGGLHALETLLAGLPAVFPLAVAIVQHREAGSDDRLSDLLQGHTALPVAEAEDKEAIGPGRVYLAPADYHLLIEDGNFALSTEPPLWYARPAIDVLFESAADVYAEQVIGVILTGANEDGARGLAAVKRCGGIAVVQDPATAESSAMPNAAIAAVETAEVLPLEEIAAFVIHVYKGVAVGGKRTQAIGVPQ